MTKVYLVTKNNEVSYGVDLEVVGVFSTYELARAFIDSKVGEFYFDVTPMILNNPEKDYENGIIYPSAYYVE